MEILELFTFADKCYILATLLFLCLPVFDVSNFISEIQGYHKEIKNISEVILLILSSL